MRKLSIFVLFLFLSKTAFCQHFYMEFGWRGGQWLNTKGINGFVKDYNDTRTWLTQKMPYVHSGTSLHFAIGTQGAAGGGVGYDVFTLEALRSTPIAYGLEPNGGQMGYRKVLFHYGGFGFGLNVNLSGSRNADFLLGFDFLFNYVALRTWYSNTNDNFKTAKPEDISNPLTPGMQIYSRLALFAGPIGIGLRPYIDLPFFSQSLLDLEHELNGGHTSVYVNWWPASVGLSANFILCPTHHRDD
jgi:hypothetical protein